MGWLVRWWDCLLQAPATPLQWYTVTWNCEPHESFLPTLLCHRGLSQQKKGSEGRSESLAASWPHSLPPSIPYDYLCSQAVSVFLRLGHLFIHSTLQTPRTVPGRACTEQQTSLPSHDRWDWNPGTGLSTELLSQQMWSLDTLNNFCVAQTNNLKVWLVIFTDELLMGSRIKGWVWLDLFAPSLRDGTAVYHFRRPEQVWVWEEKDRGLFGWVKLNVTCLAGFPV